ncbi:MAG: hypothetical protein GY927_25460 [bacterium]|nr:hypothetical protein [bacterium]
MGNRRVVETIFERNKVSGFKIDRVADGEVKQMRVTVSYFLENVKITSLTGK